MNILRRERLCGKSAPGTKAKIVTVQCNVCFESKVAVGSASVDQVAGLATSGRRVAAKVIASDNGTELVSQAILR